ncbi:MAG TPA: type VI secretion system baseplate subunit TssK, partial [Edaphobacter sp.]|nr:type VI secretion system baseplate subunit TssK [Edaphobacter sp.]
HGMLLTPDHFLRQERYLESLVAWGLRYLTNDSGLVGAGVRLPDMDLGAIRMDPEVTLHELAASLDISVARARGITPSGIMIDIETAGTLSTRFDKEQLAGVAEAVVYIVCDPGERIKTDGSTDSFNPQMRTERMPSYRIALDVTAVDREHSIAVGRIRRPVTGMNFEADTQYIPPCISLAAHSELMSGSRRIVESINRLASGYAELHRAMREFMVLFTERGLETEVDRDSMQFTERMVLELQDAAYSLLDRTQPPVHFFGRIRRMFHSAAIFFDLATGMQQYYDTLRETGESEFLGLVELQKHTLQMGRTLRLEEDLGLEVRRALQSLAALEKLERALEGKYIDFRKSATLESTNFIFDRGGKTLYRLAAKPARVQGIADDMTIFFSGLRLEGRDRYRMILVGDRNAPWLRGTSIGAEIRINEGSGFRRESLIRAEEVKLDEQYNIELDFDAPDVPTITDLRVTVPAYHTVHTALLFMRHRFYAGRRETPEARPIEREEITLADLQPEPAVAANGSYRQPGAASASRTSPPQTSSLQETPARLYEKDSAPQPPWMPRETPPASNADTNDRPRRRRLE